MFLVDDFNPIEAGWLPDGSPDLYFRVLARHYGRHIPGNPLIIVKNMPGAGTLRAANYIYNIAAKDGTELGNFSSSAAMEPLMDNDQARFDAGKFSWVGSMNQEINFCGIWQGPGAPTSFADMLGRETVFASSGGLTSFGYQHPLIFKNVFGVNVRLVSGYAGLPQAYIAMQQGEAHGLVGAHRLDRGIKRNAGIAAAAAILARHDGADAADMTRMSIPGDGAEMDADVAGQAA